MIAVMHVISGLGIGGAERMLTETAIELQRRGMRQHIVSLRGRGQYADELESAGIPVSGFDIGSISQALWAVGKLRRVVQHVGPDIVQGWMYHGDLAATFIHLLTAGRTRRRLVWNIRASNVDDARYARLVRICAWLSRWPDVVVANSEAGAKFHVSRGYRPRRMVTISNGIDTVKFCPDPMVRSEVRAELGLGDKVVVVHVARVDPMKDHATFLAAMARLPDIFGLLIGGARVSAQRACAWCPEQHRTLLCCS
jgi:glycosyltransferase involved in cell wall biosynthesis